MSTRNWKRAFSSCYDDFNVVGGIYQTDIYLFWTDRLENACCFLELSQITYLLKSYFDQWWNVRQSGDTKIY